MAEKYWYCRKGAEICLNDNGVDDLNESMRIAKEMLKLDLRMEFNVKNSCGTGYAYIRNEHGDRVASVSSTWHYGLPK